MLFWETMYYFEDPHAHLLTLDLLESTCQWPLRSTLSDRIERGNHLGLRTPYLFNPRNGSQHRDSTALTGGPDGQSRDSAGMHSQVAVSSGVVPSGLHLCRAGRYECCHGAQYSPPMVIGASALTTGSVLRPRVCDQEPGDVWVARLLLLLESMLADLSYPYQAFVGRDASLCGNRRVSCPAGFRRIPKSSLCLAQ